MDFGILSGIKVLDLSRLLPGPYCSMFLADFGAQVIIIEDQRFKDEPRIPTLLRGKKHMTLNLKQPKGREIFLKMAEEADVILEGFRPGVTDKLGIDYSTVEKINPKIVYCSISGFGQNGPYSNMVGHDINYIGFAGILEHNRQKGIHPILPPIQIADQAGGSLLGVIGIMMALYGVQKTGKGQYIDISMLDGGFANAIWLFTEHLQFNQSIDVERKTVLTGEFPFYGTYECSCGKYISLGALEPRFWKILCEYWNRKDLIPLQYSRGKDKAKVEQFLIQQFKQKTRDEWFEEFRSMDVCLGKILNYQETIDDPHIQARNLITHAKSSKGKNVKVINQPIKMSQSKVDITQKVIPDFGQHTREILKEMGYREKDMDQLQKDGVIY